MLEKWYIASNRWVQMSEGEAKCHVVWITSTPKPTHKSVVNLDFGYGGKDDEKIAERIVRSVNCHDDLLEALKAVNDWIREKDDTSWIKTEPIYNLVIEAIAKTKEEVCLKK